MYPHTITIVNSYSVRGSVAYFATVLKGVHYQDTQGVQLGTTEHFTKTEGYVQIPHDVTGYIDPNEWDELEDKTTHWTLKEGDFVIKGEHVVKKPQEVYGSRSIERLENVDYGIIIEPHFGVYLK